MANGAGRLFKVIHNTSKDSNPNTSRIISLTIKSISPFIFQRDDKLEITEDFCIFNNAIDKSSLQIGDIVIAFVFADGQQYFIQQINS